MTREGKGKGKGKGENPVPSQAASSSGHPGPSASSPSSATRLDIFCFLLSDDNHSQHIFPVTIHRDRTVGDLKDTIKLKKANNLRDIDAKGRWYAKGATKIAERAWALDQSVALWGSESAIRG